MGCRVHDRRPLGRRRRRLRPDRVRRLLDDQPRRHPPHHGQRGREGHRLAPPARPRDAGPRLDALRLGQRPRHGGRDRAPVVDVPDPDPHRRPVGGPPGLARHPRRPPPQPVRPDHDPRRPGHAAAVATPASPTPAPTRPCHPNVIHGGQKTNTIPDVIDIDVDIRTVPGDTSEVVDGYLAEVLGDLAARVEMSPIQQGESTRSPADNPLWECLRSRTQVAYPGSVLTPGLITGGTDARFYRAEGIDRLRRGAVLAGRHGRVVRPAVPRQRRAHRHRVARDVGPEFWYGIAQRTGGVSDIVRNTAFTLGQHVRKRSVRTVRDMVYPPYAAPFPDVKVRRHHARQPAAGAPHGDGPEAGPRVHQRGAGRPSSTCRSSPAGAPTP